MEIQKDIILKPFTTMRIGGPAQYFCIAKNTQDILDALAFAKKESLPIFVLGGGSNLLVSDAGFPGLVIKIEIPEISIEETPNEIFVHAGAGESWDAVVKASVEYGLSGLENLSLIPGTAGAAPIQNIGAYGSEAKDTIASVEAIHIKTGSIKTFSNSECKFGYRDSFFKSKEGKEYIVTKVAFRLVKNGTPNISYKDLALYFAEKKITKPTIAEVRAAVIEIRIKKLPDLSKLGTAGSFFKNPIIAADVFSQLQKKYPDIPKYPAGEGLIKTSAAYLLDKVCGFRGYRDGDAGVYENQALVLVNFGSATATEISALSQKMQKSVLEKTGIVLEEEVVLI